MIGARLQPFFANQPRTVQDSHIIDQNLNNEEPTMEINSSHPNLNTTSSQPTSAKSDTPIRQLDPKSPSTLDNDGDHVSLSAESLKLAKTSSVNDTTHRTSITDRHQAKQLAAQLVSDIQSQSSQAQSAFGLISKNQASGLLA